MDKIVDCTNTRINETIARLQRIDNWVKKTDREIYALFGLMYFRGILGVNIHMTDYFWCNNVKKTFQISQRPHFVSTTHKKQHSCGKQIDS